MFIADGCCADLALNYADNCWFSLAIRFSGLIRMAANQMTS